MSYSTNNPVQAFQDIHSFYKNNIKPPQNLLRQCMNDQVIQAVADHETYPAMLIWVFTQLRAYWLGAGDTDDSFQPPLLLQQLIVERLLNMLSDIEKGILKLTPLEDPNTSQPLIPYSVSNGWKITIYTRLYTWYHLDAFMTPNAIEFDPWFLPDSDLQDTLLAYDPPEDVQRKSYGFKNIS